MYKKITGIIISEVTFEEASKIINIFTSDGIVGVVCKGAKRIKSPFFGVTSSLDYGTYNIVYKENGLSKLVDADILNDYRNIKKDIKRISYATYIIELATKVYKHDSNKNIFYLCISCLNKINEGVDPEVITNIIELKLLDYLGIKPVLDECLVCGNKTDIVTISSYKGGYICKNCIDGERVVSPSSISFIRGLYYIDINRITKINIDDDIKKEINEFISDYYDRYSGIYLKSRILLDSVK